jgi:hypothetical protein
MMLDDRPGLRLQEIDAGNPLERPVADLRD